MPHLKIRQLAFIAIAQFLFINYTSAQYKSFKINNKRDTINIINQKGLNQGRWVLHVDELRGEPGYEEEGIFKNGVREGTWRRYNLGGDIIGVENYLKGGKDGLQQYFTYLGDLIKEENWKGYNPDAPFDTIAIYGTGSNEIVDFKIVKAEQYSVKNGEWRYYDPATGRLQKTEQWERNYLVQPNASKDVVALGPKKKVEKTAQMLEWEKKNKGKKKVIRDGRTGL
ncbi:MAG: hypothetical protein ABIT07_12945 [Ferruginibacter sp.]